MAIKATEDLIMIWCVLVIGSSSRGQIVQFRTSSLSNPLRHTPLYSFLRNIHTEHESEQHALIYEHRR